jgi:uncharacterized repeat protein (TIGR01451 family)
MEISLYARSLVVLIATVLGPLSVGLSAQELDKVGTLYFTKPYGKADPVLQVVTVTAGGAAIEFTPSARTLSGGDWLSISPSQDCCTTPAPLNVTANADSNLPVGSYSGQVVLTAPDSSSIIEVHLVVTPPNGAAFDKTPSQISFSLKPGGGAPTAQIMQIAGLGDGPLQWGLVGDTASERSFLRVSTLAGTAPTRISVEVLPEKLPDSVGTAGVYTSQLLFVGAGSSVTVPVTVSVGDAMVRPKRRLFGGKIGSVSAALSNSAAGNPNLWPPNTNNCFCGGFNGQETGYGAQTIAPDGTLSAKLVTEANSTDGAVAHFEYFYTDLGVGQQTLSFHLKADLDSWAYITSTVDGVVQRVWFNLNNGAVGANVPAGWTAQVTSLGNGWYRCSVTFTAASSSIYNGFGLATADQQFAYTATDGHGVFEWGQQAEHGTLSNYQPNEAPCMSVTVQRDAGLVPAGSTIGFTVSAFNQATPALSTTLNAPLPAGTGINWSISPAYGGPGTCSIAGTVGSQTLACNFSILAAGTGASVHITSGTSGSSCGTYTTTATATGGGVPFQGSDSLNVPCASLSIAKTHSGNFLIGQTAATYSVVVSNAVGAGTTSGTVTVTETVPAGLTLVSMQGSGWTCPGTAANNCTQTSALPGGASYPAITVTVSVAGNAPSQVTNQVAVSGGGSSPASASDLTLVQNSVIPTRLITDVGVYRNGPWFVDWNGNKQWDSTDADHVFSFGLPGDIPVTGDWNGDGRLKAGVYRDGAWFMDWNGNNQWDATDAAHVFFFGLPGDIPVIGDWNGDGRLKAGVYRNGTWFVDWNGNNQWDATDAAHVFSFGLPGDIPVTGDWNGDGRLKAGVYRDGVWFMDWNGNNQWDATDAAHVFSFGLPGDTPVTGDWNGDGRVKAGVYRDGVWFMDWNGNNQWDATDAAHVFSFGLPGDIPVRGQWDPARQSITTMATRVTSLEFEKPNNELPRAFSMSEYLARWKSTLHLLDHNPELRTVVERMQREQMEAELNPEVERQASNMQHDVNEIMSRPEVQTELRRMQRDMEGVRRQLERQSNK